MSQKSDAFSTQVTSLVEQFEAALAGSDWSIHRDQKRMRDEAGGVYSVPALTLVRAPHDYSWTRMASAFRGLRPALTCICCHHTTPSLVFTWKRGLGLSTRHFLLARTRSPTRRMGSDRAYIRRDQDRSGVDRRKCHTICLNGEAAFRRRRVNTGLRGKPSTA